MAFVLQRCHLGNNISTQYYNKLSLLFFLSGKNQNTVLHTKEIKNVGTYTDYIHIMYVCAICVFI